MHYHTVATKLLTFCMLCSSDVGSTIFPDWVNFIPKDPDWVNFIPKERDWVNFTPN